ncbi:MAG: SUF system Fe-S cluster assembly regulator [Alphaproteobacteria bacterium]|nr:SUF system Fe-S cluster assembly regulator [Alphaproteobacteria bacterium]MDA7982812.1 SUF system Fe-S cluster assembly regulator [Alphaproteobacteria bacterium]
MIRISRMTDYGIVLLGCLQQHHPTSANTLVQTTGIPAPTTARLLRQLTQHKILSSQQGPNGGYQLAHPPENITIAQIINALEGPIALTACVDNSEIHCSTATLCPVNGWWNTVNNAVKNALESLTLADLQTHVNQFIPRIHEISETRAQ